MNPDAHIPDLPPLLAGGWPVLHHFPHYQADKLDFWLETGEAAPLVRVRFGGRRLWVVTDADILQEMLQSKARNYPRSQAITGQNQEGMHTGETVFTARSWEAWLWRRRLLQPAFHRQELEKFAAEIVDEADKLSTGWQPGQQLPWKTMMKRLTMRIVGRTMFSAPLQETAVLQHTFEQVSEYSLFRASAMIQPPLWLPLPLYRRTRRAIETRLRLVRRLVEERLASGTPQDDLLDMLIAANLEDGTRFEAQHIVDEMISIIFAGHETTAMTLTWLFVTLARHPHLAEELYREMDVVLNGRLPIVADLPQIPTLDRLIQEVMRLYPPVYVTLREALEADRLGGYDVPQGTEFVVNIRGLHRSPRYWQEPQRFDPGRFGQARAAGRHKFAYMPFLIGPRKCIGDSFAMMEMALVALTFLRRWRFEMPGTPPREMAGFVMEPAGEVAMQIRAA